MKERPAARPGSVASFVPRRADVDALVRLALPVAMVTVSTMTMGVVDTIMVGRVSATDLAAVALGNLYSRCWPRSCCSRPARSFGRSVNPGRWFRSPPGTRWSPFPTSISRWFMALLLLVRVWTRFGRDLRRLAIEDEHG